jgi:predicted AlkP superfamily pyrophosphatase or phosphodiesterase
MNADTRGLNYTKVMVVVFDGCRPDAIAQAHTPAVDALWQTGAYTWAAQSVVPSVTLPTHLAMWRGVAPEKHGVMDNTFVSSAAHYPSAFEIARRAGRHTAMFYSWEELRDLSAPGALTMSFCHAATAGDGTDQKVAEAAAAYLAAAQPDLLFVYFGNIDLIGHDQGWMSAPYLAAIEESDRALGGLLDTLVESGLRDQYAILFLADHGGHEHMHGSALPEDMTIPWIINGRGVKRGHRLQTPVRITDTAATMLHLLDLPRPDMWDGQPVTDALAV